MFYQSSPVHVLSHAAEISTGILVHIIYQRYIAFLKVHLTLHFAVQLHLTVRLHTRNRFLGNIVPKSSPTNHSSKFSLILTWNLPYRHRSFSQQCERIRLKNHTHHANFPQWKGHKFTTVKVSLQPHLLLKEMPSRSLYHFILTIYAFLLFISFYIYNNEHLRLSCKFVVDTLLNFPTFFKIIVTNIDTSRVNAFRRLLISG